MRLDFKILWIDDQPTHVRSFEEGIKRQLAALGFELVVEAATSLTQVEDRVTAHVHDDGIDIVLVDYDLGSGSGGEEALSKVREHFPYKDVIFYSAVDREKLRKIAYDRGLDGLYFSTRLSLVDDAVSVIQKTLHKVMDIDHMRGVVMSATSDIDLIVEKTILALYESSTPAQQMATRNQILADIRDKLARWGGELIKAENKVTLSAILKLKHLCTAADRLDILLNSLSGWTASESAYLERAQTYKNDVMPRRNKMAHITVSIVDGSRVFDGPEGRVSKDDMTKLRCDLIEHRSNFTNIAVLVDVPLN